MKSSWNPKAKQASLQKWAENLHKEAKSVFLKDKTHAHILFLFNEADGCISVNPIPPKTSHLSIQQGIKRAVKEHDLYGAIFIGEAWVYLRKGADDHTAFQLLDGEMKVSDLNDDDKKECLYMRVESKDECFVWLNRIARSGCEVGLAADKKVWGEDKKWF